jgi:hypothetical protein
VVDLLNVGDGVKNDPDGSETGLLLYPDPRTSSDRPGSLKGANTGSPAASLWKSCFAETVDKHLSLPLTATSYPFRYSELNPKQLGHRLPSFCISAEPISSNRGKCR